MRHAVRAALYSHAISPTVSVQRTALARPWRMVSGALSSFGSIVVRLLRAASGVAATQTCLLALEPGDVHRFDVPSGPVRLTGLSGTLWLTTTPADGDLLLTAGESLVVRSKGPIVLQACGHGRAEVLVASGASSWSRPGAFR